MRRVLKIKMISADLDSVKFQIVEQSHRGDDFSPDSRHGDEYVCPDTGIKIISCGMPAWEDSDRTFFVRGDCTRHDNEKVWISKRDYEKLQVAVKNYNLEYGGPEPLKIVDLQDDLFVVE